MEERISSAINFIYKSFITTKRPKQVTKHKPKSRFKKNVSVVQSCDRSFISYCQFLLIYLAILLLHSLRRQNEPPLLLFATIAAFRNLFVKKDPLTRNIQRYITHTPFTFHSRCRRSLQCDRICRTIMAQKKWFTLVFSIEFITR